jgi:hypothetical protein
MQSQLASMQRDSRSVSSVNTCFHSVTHVHDNLQDVGTQLWGDRVPVNGEIYANKLLKTAHTKNRILVQFFGPKIQAQN